MNYYDIIYKNIYIDPYLNKIIDTLEFQRLRFIKQLGFAFFVFPSAVHTRFEHSIGVSHLCGLLLTSLKNKQPELNICENDIKLVKIAGLVHDLGHSSYSHFFDKFLLKNNTIENDLKFHEGRTCYIFKKIIKKINIDLNEHDINFICDLINPKEKLNISKEHNKAFISEIVCNNKNGLDCDKIDYIMRDCKYLNNIAGNIIQYEEIVKNARVINNTICYSDNIALILHQIYSIRYTNHKIYYQNPTIRSIEYMFEDALSNSNLHKEICDNLHTEKFYEYTDSLFNRMLYDEENTKESKDILKNILERKLYKFIDEIVFNLDNTEDKISLNKQLEAIKNFLKINNIENDFIIEKYNLNYSMGKKNPLDMIRFYKLKNLENSFDYFKISKIIPNNFEETIVRIFIKNNKKNIINKINMLFPGIEDSKYYTNEELGELFILLLTMDDD